MVECLGFGEVALEGFAVEHIDADSVWNLERVSVDEDIDKGWHSVVLDATRRGEAIHFEIQLDVDEEERDDGYCIVDSAAPHSATCDAEASVVEMAFHRTLYGGIEECGIVKKGLYFVLSRRAQELFNWPRVLVFALSLDRGQRSRLESGLRIVLSAGCKGGYPVLRL